MSVGALILAAGASSRFGSPKQIARVYDETLLDRTIRIAHQAGCSPVVVVLGAFADEIRTECILHDVATVLNLEWRQGMGSSLAAAIPLLADTGGTLVLTCDMLSVTTAHLQALMASGELTGSAYADKVGVPAYFPKSSYSSLASLRGDAGARALLTSARRIVLPGGELDIDTPEDLRNALTSSSAPAW